MMSTKGKDVFAGCIAQNDGTNSLSNVGWAEIPYISLHWNMEHIPAPLELGEEGRE